MIQIEQIKGFFPAYIQADASRQKYMLKEYLQLMILDYLTTTPFVRKLVFIGGTYLRLKYGIDRFSEDLDFDCKDMSKEDFIKMTDDVLLFIRRSGFDAEIRSDENPNLKAFRRNIYFPELLFKLGLSGYKNERFLLKIEAEDQRLDYTRQMANIKGCGFFFSFPAPTDAVICAMKISALLSRKKGRDFYDVMFLLQLTQPDYAFLKAKCNINDVNELKSRLQNLVTQIDLKHKSQDFKHLVFQQANTNKILLFEEFVNSL
jgi:predicted nucleotidyltransferase component of viral defense system